MVFPLGALRPNGLTLLTLLLLAVHPAWSENVANFYPQDGAKTVFSPELQTTALPDFNYGAAQFESPEPISPMQAAAQSGGDAQLNYKPLTEQQLVARFGDPAQELPVIDKGEGPLPLRAMQHALQAGNRRMAFEYAKQYVRYLNQLSKRSEEVQKLVAAVTEPSRPVDSPQLEAVDDYADTSVAGAVR